MLRYQGPAQQGLVKLRCPHVAHRPPQHLRVLTYTLHTGELNSRGTGCSAPPIQGMWQLPCMCAAAHVACYQCALRRRLHSGAPPALPARPSCPVNPSSLQPSPPPPTAPSSPVPAGAATLAAAAVAAAACIAAANTAPPSPAKKPPAVSPHPPPPPPPSPPSSSNSNASNPNAWPLAAAAGPRCTGAVAPASRASSTLRAARSRCWRCAALMPRSSAACGCSTAPWRRATSTRSACGARRTGGRRAQEVRCGCAKDEQCETRRRLV